MATISSISGAQTAPQSGLLQIKLQQATRDAEQAEQVARSLQGEVSAAQQAAARAQQNAGAIAAEARRAEVVAGQAQANLAAVRSQQSAPRINTQGQVTGTVVNTTA